MKPRVVIFAEYYLPGFKAGGPVRSLSAFIDAFKDQYEFIVITRNHDFADSTPYAVTPNVPEKIEGTTIYYLTKDHQTISFYRQILLHLKPDVIYLNAFWNPRFVLFPILATKFISFPCKIILAPRGSLSPGALKIKALKKCLYFFLVKPFYKNITFHATASSEKNDIQCLFPKATVQVASNLFYSEQLEQE